MESYGIEWSVLLEWVKQCTEPAEVFAKVEPYLDSNVRIDSIRLSLPLSPLVGYAVALLTERDKNALDILTEDDILAAAADVIVQPTGAAEAELWPIYLIADSVPPEGSVALVERLLAMIPDQDARYVYEELLEPHVSVDHRLVDRSDLVRVRQLVRRFAH